jgi:uncharacterized membrane protein YfhO
MGFLIFLAVILYILFKTWKQVVKFILIGIILMFAFTVVKLKEVYDYLSEPTQTEQTVDDRPNVDSVITKVDTGLVCE